MGEIRDEHGRDWFKSRARITFEYDYLRDKISNDQIRIELLNVDGSNAERIFTDVDSSTVAERNAVKAAMRREIDNKLINDAYVPFPEMQPIVPVAGDVLTGTILVQIEVLSLTAGEMTVEFRTNGGNWMSTTYNATSGYYEKSVNSTQIANGDYLFQIRAQNGGGVLLEQEFEIEVNN